MDLSSSVTEIKGVGSKKAELLEKLNIFSLNDLLAHYPRTYQDRTNIRRIRELSNGEEALISGRVLRSVLTGNPYKKPVLHILIGDGSGINLEVIFFNGKWLKDSIKIGEEYSFFGRAEIKYGKYSMLHPEYSKGDAEGSEAILPIYPLTEGLRQSDLRKWVREALKTVADDEEYLPEWLIKKYNLCAHGYALRNLHFPNDRQSFAEAKYRLIFDELLMLQLGIMIVREDESHEKGIAFSKEKSADEFVASLPYSLTGAQSRVIGEIMNDLESTKAMNRLVQGDVGSGKTAVAEIALFKAVKCGYQGAMMAPTEILAKQHFAEMKRIFEPFGINVDFLGGNLTAKERRAALARLAAGETDIIVGTHALVQPDVKFANVGLVITDEQHRFGVNQRKLLTEKGDSPNRLVMTATPIPRTLAVILYGDLDISIIDELPPGRQKVTTKAVTENGRIKAYELMRSEVKNGRQCYIVAPLIEDSESYGARSAESIYEEVKTGFSDMRVSLLHGAMKQAEKDDIMGRFASGEIDILISTVVIEVGINVPNATVMIIENSERFGLAQLHQLRGRIGRGSHKSYCVLVLGSDGEIARERAKIMCESSDGFYISEQDLKLRGPGEIFGTRQHGLPDMKLADMARHSKILAASQSAAKEIIGSDKKLEKAENSALADAVRRLFGGSLELQL